MSVENETVLGLNRMARRLRVTQKWLKEEADAGRLPYLKAGTRYLFDPQTVEQVLKQRASAESKPITFATAAKALGIKTRTVRKLAKKIGIDAEFLSFQQVMGMVLFYRCIESGWPEKNVREVAIAITNMPETEVRRAVVAVTGGGLIHMPQLAEMLDKAISAIRKSGGPKDE